MNIHRLLLLLTIAYHVNSVVFALEVRTFCFKGRSAQQVYQSISDLLLPKDNAEVMGDCLEVAGTQMRLDVIEALVARQASYTRADRAGQATSGKQCRIELEKISNKKLHDRNLDLGAKNNWKDAESNSGGREVSTLVLSAGRPGSMTYETSSLQIICQPRGQDFELEFSFAHASGGASSTVTVSPGQKINVASVVKDLNGKNRELNVRTGISKTDSEGAEQTDYFLSVR